MISLGELFRSITTTARRSILRGHTERDFRQYVVIATY